MTTPPLRDFLEIPYEQLEEMNLSVKQARLNRESPDKLRREVGELLARFGLLAVEGDRLRVHAALARYRPDADAEVDGQTSENALTSQMFGDDQP